MKQKLYGGLRWLFGKREVEVEAACCVLGCTGTPLVVLAATESSAIYACSDHATQWLSSDDGRVARADQGSVIPVLKRWAAKRSMAVATSKALRKAQIRPIPA